VSVEPPVDLEKVRSFLEAKARRRYRLLDARLNEAKRDFEKIVRMIRRKYAPRRIYQWGSLLHPERFTEISDIDIAVEGVGSVESFFALLRDAEALSGFPLDIVEIERIHPLHAESIKKKGKLIYEKP
jgi:predicted nucleotidyltransferase